MNECCTNLPDLAFVDLETGGLNPFEAEILQVCIWRLRHVDVMQEDIRVSQKLNVYIMPRNPREVHVKAAEVNGFSISKWEEKNAVDITEAWSSICDLLDGTLFVAQNAHFDYAFLMHAQRNENLRYISLADYHLVDLSSLAHMLRCAGRIPNVSMDTISEHYGYKRRVGRHSAHSDVQRAIQNYRGLMSEIGLHG